MKKHFFNLKRIHLVIFIFCFCVFTIPGCQYRQYKIGHSIIKPEDLGRIRVTAFVYSNIGEHIISALSPEDFEKNAINGIWKMFNKEDIYEFVFIEDLDPVLPSGKPSRYQTKTDNYLLAREIGRLAYLDYIMIVTRSISRMVGVDLEVAMVNVETGKSFEARRKLELVRRAHTFWRDLWRGLYKEIFDKVKVDLTITAGRKKKGEIKSISPEKPIVKREERVAKVVKKEDVQEEVKKLREERRKSEALVEQMKHLQEAKRQFEEKAKETLAEKRDLEQKLKQAEQKRQTYEDTKIKELEARRRAAEEKLRKEAEEKKALEEELKRLKAERKKTILIVKELQDKKAKEKRLAYIPKEVKETKPLPDKAAKIDLLVNDLKTMNLSPVIGLILSEHLRSELFKTNKFRIINRENLKEALKEMGVQMTGIVEESQAVKAGKGLGVKKMVSGSIGHLGDYYTLSLKFINIETLETERMIFEKVKALSEEILFNTIDLMAQKLARRSE